MIPQFYKINPSHKLILWNICIKEMNANHILKIYIIHIYQIFLKLLGVVQKKISKQKIELNNI